MRPSLAGLLALLALAGCVADASVDVSGARVVDVEFRPEGADHPYAMQEGPDRDALAARALASVEAVDGLRRAAPDADDVADLLQGAAWARLVFAEGEGPRLSGGSEDFAYAFALVGGDVLLCRESHDTCGAYRTARPLDGVPAVAP